MKKISYAVVIPTNRVFDSIQPLLVSLIGQSISPDQVVVVRDRYASKSEFDTYMISLKLLFAQLPKLKVDLIHPMTDAKLSLGQGASYVRNYGRQQVVTPYMMFIDDDNVCPEDMCENLFGFVTHQGHPENTLVAPLQYDATQSTIRPALASGFSFLLSRPVWLNSRDTESDERYYPLMLASSNCLAGSTILFASYPFDEQVPFIYEDLVMVGRMWKGGVTILADSWAHVIHHHTHRNKLSELYANTPDRAYYKAKHRIILINIIGNWWQKIIFYTIGFIGQLGWIGLHILYYAPPAQWSTLFGSLWRGTKDGLAAIKK